MSQKQINSQILGGHLMQLKTHLAGNYKGFYLVVEPGKEQYIVTIAACRHGGEGREELKEFLRQHQEIKRQISGFSVETYEVKLSIQIRGEEGIPELMNGVMEPLLDYLLEKGYTSGCQKCGQPVSLTDQYEIGKDYCYLCHTCAEQISGGGKGEKSKILPGMLGALLGAVPGGMLWVLLLKWGFIAGLAGFLVGIGAAEGYRKLGRSLDGKGVFLSLVVTAFVIALASRIGWTWVVYDELKFYGFTFNDVYFHLGEILEEAEMKGEYQKTWMMGYALTVLCSVGMKVRTLFEPSSKQQIRKIKI